MADTNASPAPQPRRRGLRVVVAIVAVLLVLLVAAYFVGTSAWFLKSVILPKVSQKMNARITTGDASISPFSQVTLRNFKVETTGPEPVFSAAEIRARYHLMDIIRGNMNIDEVFVASPVVFVSKDAEGKSNLDPLMQSSKEEKKEEKPSKPGQSEKPMQLNLKTVQIKDGSVRTVQDDKDGSHQEVQLSGLNFTAENLRNGQTGKINLNSGLQVTQRAAAPATNGSLRATLNGSFSLGLSPDLKPTVVQGTTRMQVAEATGALAQATGFDANLNCDITPTDIKQVALRFARSNTGLGELRVSGPFNMEKSEGNLRVQLASIDKNLLNLLGAAQGLDFGPTTLNSTNQVQITKSGSMVQVAGALNLNRFQVTRTNQTTPSLDFQTKYDLTVDNSAKAATLRELSMTGSQQNRQFLRGGLSKPMQIGWGDASNAIGDSSFKLELSDFNLADWKPFIGDVAPEGVVRAEANVLSQNAGKVLTFDFSTGIENLTVVAGSNRLSRAQINLSANGKATDMKVINLTAYKFSVGQNNRELAHVSGSGDVNTEAETADLKLTGGADLSALLQSFPQPDMEVSSGKADLNARVARKKTLQEVTGNLSLANFSGRLGSNVFRDFGTSMELNVAMEPEVVQVRNLAGKLTSAGQPGGSFQLSGNYHTNGAAQFKATLADFNQHGLKTFLEPMLGGKELLNVALNGNANIQYDPKADSAIQANLQVTNLVVRDPSQQARPEPLEMGMQFDASIKNKVAEIKQARLALRPTEKAKNEVNLTGKVDMSVTNETQGRLTLTSEALDVTPYYDLFMAKPAGEKASAATSPQTSPITPAPAAGAGPEKEPDPIKLPFRNFVAEVKVGRLYLHELDLTNIQAVLELNGSKVKLSPCQLSMNGAPVKMTLDSDLSVPGFKYTLDASAVQVPFAPLVNTFAPERRGKVQGTLTATANLAGQGTTGGSLQRYLGGKFDIGTTNLNLQVTDVKSPVLRATINIISILPSLIKGGGGSAAALSSLAGAVLGGGSSQAPGWTDELSKSPIDVIQARGNIGQGVVTLENALLQSPAFQAVTHGTVHLQPILTNSVINFPLGIRLVRGLAEKISFVPAGTPTNATYVELPEFVTMKGTVGNPQREINTRALLGSALQQFGGKIPGTDQKTGNLIQGLGGLIGGNTATGTTPAAGSNAPASSGGLLGGLGGVLGGQKTATNAPMPTNAQPGLLQGLGGLLGGGSSSTNAAPRTNRSGGGLLDQLLGPGRK